MEACWGLLPSRLAAWLQVLSFAGELLAHAESLLRDGLHTSEVADGYSKACVKVSIGLHPARGQLLLVSGIFMLPCNAAPLGPNHAAVLQALSVLDTLVVDGTEKLDVRNKNEARLL